MDLVILRWILGLCVAYGAGFGLDWFCFGVCDTRIWWVCCLCVLADWLFVRVRVCLVWGWVLMQHSSLRDGWFTCEL